MTINKFLSRLSAEGRRSAEQYYHSIQPFHVLPSPTLEFDGKFDDDGETIFAEINLNKDDTIDDMFCTCGSGGLCVHLATMMLDIEKMNTVRCSKLLGRRMEDS